MADILIYTFLIAKASFSNVLQYNKLLLICENEYNSCKVSFLKEIEENLGEEIRIIVEQSIKFCPEFRKSIFHQYNLKPALSNIPIVKLILRIVRDIVDKFFLLDDDERILINNNPNNAIFREKLRKLYDKLIIYYKSKDTVVLKLLEIMDLRQFTNSITLEDIFVFEEFIQDMCAEHYCNIFNILIQVAEKHLN
ncbi:hypothetical protein H312_01823 [Anncaliia algerae PRA339]|uniref:Uncharacterized protein n=1 Tax=Anncaliia algerae PRA339 TaxID=1288291 RepID=A0A059F0R2_9MICR|nr:hypothetical protein H312_01823 [Anncaliia algerae PRA339]